MRLGSVVDGESADFQIMRVAVHDDLAGLDAGLLQSFANGKDEREWVQMPLPPRPFVFRPMTLSDRKNALPAVDGIVEAGPGGYGTIEQVLDAFLVSFAPVGCTAGSRAITTCDLPAAHSGPGQRS